MTTEERKLSNQSLILISIGAGLPAAAIFALLSGVAADLFELVRRQPIALIPPATNLLALIVISVVFFRFLQRNKAIGERYAAEARVLSGRLSERGRSLKTMMATPERLPAELSGVEGSFGGDDILVGRRRSRSIRTTVA